MIIKDFANENWPGENIVVCPICGRKGIERQHELVPIEKDAPVDLVSDSSTLIIFVRGADAQDTSTSEDDELGTDDPTRRELKDRVVHVLMEHAGGWYEVERCFRPEPDLAGDRSYAQRRLIGIGVPGFVPICLERTRLWEHRYFYQQGAISREITKVQFDGFLMVHNIQWPAPEWRREEGEKDTQ